MLFVFNIFHKILFCYIKGSIPKKFNVPCCGKLITRKQKHTSFYVIFGNFVIWGRAIIIIRKKWKTIGCLIKALIFLLCQLQIADVLVLISILIPLIYNCISWSNNYKNVLMKKSWKVKIWVTSCRLQYEVSYF